MTYAHTHQNISLPRLITGTQRRHLALAISDGDFDVATLVTTEPTEPESELDLYGPIDACDACPPYGAPAISCDQHGYIFSREQYDGGEWPSYEKSQAMWPNSGDCRCEFHAATYGYPMYDDFYDYYDYLDDSLEEMAAVEREIDAFINACLREEAPTKPEPWQQENNRHCIAKRKRTHRGAISRSASHRRRDGSVSVRGRREFDSRGYEFGVTPRRDYLAMKEAEF